MQEEASITKTISDKTPIQVGFVIVLLGICAAGFGGWIWWAATISSKLDTLIGQQAVMVQTATALQREVADLQAWRKIIDTVGSPTMVQRANETDKKLEELRRQLDLHEAKTSNKITP